ncbi:MAG: DNA-3-methyladenine glycosylase I [Sulfurospirillum sp.]|nr:DNA-3-methyladenine glycosylase I [Sulfurospirillum sp.]
MQKKRCAWVKNNDATYVVYHDEEWGVPLFNERGLFELFSLETQAAGLSWLTVLKKRESYRSAFANFDIATVAGFTCREVDAIMQMNIIKNRAKIEAIIHNAKLFLHVQKEYGSLVKFFWGFVGGKPIVNSVEDYKIAPCSSPISDAITKELKKRGFKFIGTITIYAFMQACGMVNDHEHNCCVHS